MSFYIKSGNTFKVSSKEAMDIHDSLPANNFIVKQDISGTLYLEQIESFLVKGKLYGDVSENANRILNTFNERSFSTGAALVGEKGSGKTLLSKLVCIRAAENNIPTILINAPWTGDKFNAFIQSIDQPCIIFFDEFEKVYKREEQEQVLTLLDGVFPSKKLFMITCNDKSRIDYYMRNRPGRIYYFMEFKGLDVDFIQEYCNDNLIAKNYIETICKIAGLFSQFNFDMIKALVEEMNRYGESPQQVMKLLNVKPEFVTNYYTVTLEVGGKIVNTSTIYPREWKGIPLREEDILIEVDSDPDKDDYDQYRFKNTDLIDIDHTNGGKFVFVNSDKHKLTLTRIQESKVNIFDAL